MRGTMRPQPSELLEQKRMVREQPDGSLVEELGKPWRMVAENGLMNMGFFFG